MTVDSEAIFALVEVSDDIRGVSRGALRLDGDRLARRARPGHRVRRARAGPAALARRGPLRGRVRVDRRPRSSSWSATRASAWKSARSTKGTLVTLRDGAVAESDEAFALDRSFTEEPLPAVRAPDEGRSCLERLAALAAGTVVAPAQA